MAQCYEQVLKDLNDALGGLTKEKHDAYMNYWSVKALLSRVYLYMNCLLYTSLTTHPGDSVSTDLALSTEQDIDNAVNGLYDLMSSDGYYGGTMFFYGDMKGDDMQLSLIHIFLLSLCSETNLLKIW